MLLTHYAQTINPVVTFVAHFDHTLHMCHCNKTHFIDDFYMDLHCLFRWRSMWVWSHHWTVDCIKLMETKWRYSSRHEMFEHMYENVVKNYAKRKFGRESNLADRLIIIYKTQSSFYSVILGLNRRISAWLFPKRFKITKVMKEIKKVMG